MDTAALKRKLLIAAIVLVAAAAVYFFGVYKPSHKYDAFARCLSQKQVKMYGAYWCPHCTDQKDKFSAAFQYVTYIECGIKGQRGQTQECQQAGIKQFPTWVFPDGEKHEGEYSLETLSAKTGCDLP